MKSACITSRFISWVVLVYLSVVSSSFSSEKIAFYHYDLLGSPVAATNEKGEVLWREEYSPYGNKLLNQDAMSDNARGYTGHVHDAETGLTYMQARYYDPEIGRFMSIDPVEFKVDNPVSFNRYAYGNNNPYKYIDPNGEEPGSEETYGPSWGDNDKGRADPYNLEISKSFFSDEWFAYETRPLSGYALQTEEIPEIRGLLIPTAIFAGLRAFLAVNYAALKGADDVIALTKARFGHTFTTHGQEATEFLMKRAAGSGKPMGQFLEDQAAARLIQDNLGKLKNGAIPVPVAKGFPARVIMPDGSFAPPSSIRLVPSGTGVKTAYPEL